MNMPEFKENENELRQGYKGYIKARAADAQFEKGIIIDTAEAYNVPDSTLAYRASGNSFRPA